MKKVLFGTTALMAAAAYTSVAMADPITLSIGGKQEFYFGIADVENGDGTVYRSINPAAVAAGATHGTESNEAYGGTGASTDTELYFSGQTTLDNGLTVMAMIQIEADENGATNADETYMTLSGGFGSLQLGLRQGAHANMANSGFDQGGVDWDEALYSGNWSPQPDSLGPIFAGTIFSGLDMGQSRLDFVTPNLTYYSSDDVSVAYISPEFFGFSVGATYTPDVAGTGLTDYSNTGNRKDQFDAAVAFSNEFYGVGIDADFGYLYGFGTSSAPSYEMFRVGGALSYAGFSIGGAWADHEYDGDNTNARDGMSWQAGAGYENGPYGIDFNYYHGETEGSFLVAGDTLAGAAHVADMTNAGIGDEDTTDYYKLTGRYDLGPGIMLNASVYHVNYDNDMGMDRQITGGLMGVGLRF
ncbi:porin [Roseospira visakhapatnamensis]|uniref:Outer membrane protein OmpU n=1 Tax=Roseospira visakhapatnamensis TaxID=390880 RepID=A0A7W6WAT5_9PROT|nr:porin [Roseospira visakhapatnamensis]MBB4267304.1 outer membrane protein OmpU [Roseospira visakhapatnamensis]